MPKTLVLHSSEIRTLEATVRAVEQNNTRPHWVSCPATNRLVPLLPIDQPARTLRHPAGTPETNNRGGVWQVEIVGYAAEIPTYDQLWYSNLAGHIVEMCDLTGTPKTFPFAFNPYPASYGPHAPQRLTAGEWAIVEGIIGHQHVPFNDHGDPGDINRVIPLVTNPEEHDTMLTTLQTFAYAMATVKDLYESYYPGAPENEARIAHYGKHFAQHILVHGLSPEADIRYLATTLAADNA